MASIIHLTQNWLLGNFIFMSRYVIAFKYRFALGLVKRVMNLTGSSIIIRLWFILGSMNFFNRNRVKNSIYVQIHKSNSQFCFKLIVEYATYTLRPVHLQYRKLISSGLGCPGLLGLACCFQLPQPILPSPQLKPLDPCPHPPLPGVSQREFLE